jgi:5-carboxymethyl-2-hydroxymuconate isomerase
MFPLAHVYVVSRVTGSDEAELILGSVVVDIAEISFGRVGKRLLEEPEEFYWWVKKHYPKAVKLALGVLSHTTNSRGLDYYSDNLGGGFAMEEGEKIRKMPEFNGLKVKKKRIFGHTLFEIGTDLNLVRDRAEILKMYQKSWKEADKDFISRVVAEFGSEEEKEVRREIGRMEAVFNSVNYRMAAGLAESGGLLILGKLFSFGRIGKAVVLEERLRKQTRSRYLNYLDKSVAAIRRDWKNRPWSEALQPPVF